MRGWFLHLLNWVQQLQNKFKHRLIKTTHLAFPDFVKRQKHWSSSQQLWWEGAHAMPCLQDSLSTGRLIPTCTKCPLLLLKVMAHSVHVFIHKMFSDTDSHLLNTFYVSGSVLRIVYALFHKKIPHHPHFTDEEPTLVNLPRSHKRKIWNTNRGPTPKARA